MTRPGPAEVIEILERPDPIPGPWDLLIDVEASALNRADLLQRRGHYPAPTGSPADILGLECAGTVIGCGKFVTRFAVGDAVMAVVGGGACATRLTVHERLAIPRPAGMSATDAAAIPEAFMTAYDAAVLQGGLTSGSWLAVDAVGSGVGTAAVQIARAIGARSAGCSRTESKLASATALGLDLAVHGTTDELAKRLQALHEGASVGLALVGGPMLTAMVDALQPGGTAVLVGLMAGVKAELFLPTVLRRRLHIVGTVLRSRPLEEKMRLAQQFTAAMVPLFEGAAPRLRPVVHAVYPLSAIVDAHRAMEANTNFGKIVVSHA